MNMNKLILSALIAGSITTSMVWAAVDTGQGTLHFTGSVIDSPCSVAPGDEDIDVPLGQISNKVLSGTSAAYSQTQPITIRLHDCVFADNSAPKVTVKFAGTADSQNAQLYANTGTAQGVGIRLMDTMAGNIPLKANDPSAERVLTLGENLLKFGARLEAVSGSGSGSGTIATGTVAADVTFSFDYN